MVPALQSWTHSKIIKIKFLSHPTDVSKCLDLFLWRFYKNQFQFIRFIFVDDRDLKSSIKRGDWSFTYCFWNSPILYTWQLFAEEQYWWFTNHSFFLAITYKKVWVQWLERCSDHELYSLIAIDWEIAQTTSRKGISRENKQSEDIYFLASLL